LKAEVLKQLFRPFFPFGIGLVGFLFGLFLIKAVSRKFRRLGYHKVASFSHIFVRTATGKAIKEYNQQQTQATLPCRNHATGLFHVYH
jgi:hypothetical protein